MSYNQHSQTSSYAGVRDTDIGLQNFMRDVYNQMTIGLAISGLVAWGISNVEPLYNAIHGNWLVSMIAIFSPMAFILLGFTPGRIARSSSASVRTLFMVFSAVMGVSMASLFVHFTGESLARVFFITAGTFAAMSLYGYTTKRNLSGMGSFMIMGMIGIIFASIINIFMGIAWLHFAISIIGVVVFTGLTAYETQMLKEIYSSANDGEANDKAATMGALSLYMSFINIFQFLLSLTGRSE